MVQYHDAEDDDLAQPRCASPTGDFDPEDYPELASFYYDGWIQGYPYVVKSGKEATVYRCAATPRSDCEFLAVKVYRPRIERSFKNDAIYQQGRVIVNARDRRAVKSKSEWGRGVQFSQWVGHEFEALQRLYALGADVPEPYATGAEAILIEYIGDDTAPAPQLKAVSLDKPQAVRMFDRIYRNIEKFLASDIVHGDLSPYNILVWNDRAVIIDLPQAIDPRQNSMAFDLLARDIRNVHGYFAPYGVRADPARLAHSLWHRYQRGEL